MVFGLPVSWLVTEAFALFVFLFVLAHAIRSDNPVRSSLELFGFMTAAAIFENIGVYGVHAYAYDLRRVMMIGGVPLEILMLEASIWYVGFNLARALRLPVWGQPFAVGLFGSVQDLTIDPAAVFDRHALTDPAQIESWNKLYPGAFGDGVMSGQWNWTNPGYQDMLFGIPFYNCSGWFYLMAYFTLWVLVGRWLSQRYALARYYGAVIPFLTVLLIASPVNRFLLSGYPFAEPGSRSVEIALVCLHYAFAIGLLVAFASRFRGINLARDGRLLLGVPLALHLYDVAYVVIMGTTMAYVPVFVVTVIHGAYLGWIFSRSRRPAPNVALAV